MAVKAFRGLFRVFSDGPPDHQGGPDTEDQ